MLIGHHAACVPPSKSRAADSTVRSVMHERDHFDDREQRESDPGEREDGGQDATLFPDAAGRGGGEVVRCDRRADEPHQPEDRVPVGLRAAIGVGAGVGVVARGQAAERHYAEREAAISLGNKSVRH